MTPEERKAKIEEIREKLRNAPEERKKAFPMLYALTEQLLMELEYDYVSDQTIKDTIGEIKNLLG
jgi:hypothetical protein